MSRTKDVVENQREQKARYKMYSYPRSAAQNGPHRKMLFFLELLDTGAGNFRKILRLLLVDDIDNIIDVYQPHEPVVGVHHRHAQQVIFGDDACHFLLVGSGGHLDDVRVHQVFELRAWLRYYEFS